MVLWRHFAPSAGWEIEILATDISTRVLERARKGICPIETARDVPPEYLKHFMLRGTGKQEGKMKAGAEIGVVIRFERLNLNDVTYPVTSLFDLILCRNVLIYFDQQHRCEILDRLLAHLRPGGFFLIGHSERLAGMTEKVVDVLPTIYVRVGEMSSTEMRGAAPRKDMRRPMTRRNSNPLRVLVVDDSAVMREAVSTVLSQEPGFTVVTAADPLIAMIKMSRQCPDVIVLDLEMPRMGGITFLRKIMIENPIPVVVCSVHVGAGAALAIEALEAGAVYVVSKPQIGAREFIYESAVTLIDAVRAAAKAKARIPYRRLTLAVEPALSGDAVVQQTARPGQLRAATRLLLLARPLEARRRCGSSSKRCPQMLLVS